MGRLENWKFVMSRSIIARDDTLLGVCHAIGEDFGFNPLYLRIAFAVVLFWSPVGAFAGYAALGALVAFSRWMVPVPPAAGAQDDPVEESAPEEFPLAA
jgi:phage shock protein PspC (stress-responsive transcriptional regulator)